MNLARPWRRWILGWVFVALIGIQFIESTHHHDTALLKEVCAVCHVVAHNPLDLAPPPAAPLAALLFLLFFLPRWRQTFRITQAPCASYHSRAPPSHAA